MKRLPFRRGGTLALALAVLAAVAMALWLGVFSQDRAAASPDVDLTVTVASTPASGTTLAPGSTISYTVTVTSAEAASAVDGNITLNIDLDNATYVAASLSVTGGVTCNTAVLPIACQVPNFTAAGSKTVSFSATVGAIGPVLVGAAIDPPLDGSTDEVDEGVADPDFLKDQGDDETLDCSLVGEGTDTAPDDEPDNFDCTSHAVGTADLTISKTAVPAEGTILPPGTTITYTLIASNAGSGTAPNVLIRDILGTGLTYYSAGGTGVTCTHPSAQQIDCIVTSLVPGVPATVTVVATVAVSAGTLLNGAYIDPANAITETNEEGDDPILDCAAVGEVVGGTADPDNFDCTTHTGGAVDLTITKTASPGEGMGAKTGDTITYTLTVANSASATVTATNVLIRDILGTGLTYVSATGPAVTCTHTSAQQIDCTAASIAAGASATVTVVATVSATSGPVLNGARVDPGSVITETNEDADDGDYDCSAVGEGTDVDPATEPDNFDCTRHTLTAATPTPTPTATVTPGVLLNCPLSGKWALSVWNGPTGKTPAEALATCTGVTIVAAYSLDPTSNVFLHYFPGRGTDVNNLVSLSNMQAILTLAQ